MFARIAQVLHLSRGNMAMITAYGAVMAVAAGLTLMMMMALTGPEGEATATAFLGKWVVVPGGLGAALALYMASGWFGGRGALGLARAAMAIVIVTLLVGVIAGTVVAPFYGTLVGPFVLLADFLAMPILGGVWLAVLIGAHFLIGLWRTEREEEIQHANERAVTHLSSLSQANLYGGR